MNNCCTVRIIIHLYALKRKTKQAKPQFIIFGCELNVLSCRTTFRHRSSFGFRGSLETKTSLNTFNRSQSAHASFGKT